MVVVSASLRDIKVFTTFPHDCSYLQGQEATTLFIDPRQRVSEALYTQLSLLGFRRSGDHIYRPHCARCSACIAARVPVRDFTMSRSQRRVWQRNRDLTLETCSAIFDDESYDLYSRYIKGRHADGDMYPPDRDQYQSFLNNGLGCTRYFKLRKDEQLIAVLVCDEMLDGLSAIYTFYDPDEHQRSLGTYAVLVEIEQARQRQLDYLYLGYWIQDCHKMNYKSKFQPLELLLGGEWQRHEQLPTVSDQQQSLPLHFVDNPR
mgnify:CR=1 FL=1